MDSIIRMINFEGDAQQVIKHFNNAVSVMNRCELEIKALKYYKPQFAEIGISIIFDSADESPDYRTVSSDDMEKIIAHTLDICRHASNPECTVESWLILMVTAARCNTNVKNQQNAENLIHTAFEIEMQKKTLGTFVEKTLDMLMRDFF